MGFWGSEDPTCKRSTNETSMIFVLIYFLVLVLVLVIRYFLVFRQFRFR